MVFSTLLSLLLFSVYFLKLIRQEIPLIAGLPLVIAFFLLLGSSLISWRSKKQTLVAHSNTETEYHTLADTTFELI